MDNYKIYVKIFYMRLKGIKEKNIKKLTEFKRKKISLNDDSKSLKGL